MVIHFCDFFPALALMVKRLWLVYDPQPARITSVVRYHHCATFCVFFIFYRRLRLETSILLTLVKLVERRQ